VNEPMRSSRRFKLIAGTASALSALVTAIVPDWIEAVFRLNLDAGSGAIEWTIVASFAVASATLFAWARAERRA
jgi:hypothetical protein